MANCPHDVFIRRLAKELGVSLETAREIYEAMTVVAVELLDEYDTVKPLTLVTLERKEVESKEYRNPQTGEICISKPKSKIKASVSRHYSEYDNAYELVDKRKIKQEKREERERIRQAQLEQERKEKEKEKREKKKLQQKERERQRMIERIAEIEKELELEEERQYKKDLRKRLKG